LIGLAALLARNRISPTPIDLARAAGQLLVVCGEEFGWRGFLLPRLRRGVSPVSAIALTTVAWGAWHAPMFFVEGSPQAEDSPGHFAAAIFCWSALHHLLQIGRPSVATAMLFHAAANIAETTLGVGTRRRWRTGVYVAAGVAASIAAKRFDRARSQGLAPM
jgi:membrane protease YdiL (CAAX protease family)